MEFVALTAVLAILEYLYFTMRAGMARMKYGIAAPATTGHEIFERHFRVQQNTLEQLVIFLPSLYLFGVYVHAVSAALLGLVFVLGRALYAGSYIRDPARRGPGMIIGMLACAVLLLGALIGLLWSLI